MIIHISLYGKHAWRIQERKKTNQHTNERECGRRLRYGTTNTAGQQNNKIWIVSLFVCIGCTINVLMYIVKAVENFIQRNPWKYYGGEEKTRKKGG